MAWIVSRCLVIAQFRAANARDKPRAVIPGRPQGEPGMTAEAHLTVAKNFLTSRTNSSGCSNAAKWPPFSISLQWVMLGKFGSIQRRTGVMISLGNTATPVGTFTVGRERRLPKLSQ